MKYFYCPICGKTYLFYSRKCENCNNQVELVRTLHDTSYYEEKSIQRYGNDEHDEEILLEEEITHNPLYNSTLKRAEDESNKEKEHEAYMNDLRAKINENLKREEEERHRLNNDPRCPTCSSYNVKRISGMKRAVHGYAFGIFSKTAFSQFECMSCGYKW